MKDKIIWVLIFAIGGGTLYWMCAPQTWRDRKNWDHGGYQTPAPAQGPQKQTLSQQYIYKDGVKYRETWYRYK